MKQKNGNLLSVGHLTQKDLEKWATEKRHFMIILKTIFHGKKRFP